METKEVGNIFFGTYSPEEILAMSVCEVTNTDVSGEGSIYNEKMGSSAESDENCVTCLMEPLKCPGHFGHIKLNEYIVNPLYHKMVIWFLRCFCKDCSRMLLTKEQIIIRKLDKYKSGEKRFKMLMEVLKKINICYYCSAPQPEVSTNKLNAVFLNYKENLATPIIKEKGMVTTVGIAKKKVKITIELSIEEILVIFDRILDTDVELIGIDPSLTHPRNIILSMFPVPPPCVRPYVISDGITVCDDDLTTQLIEIVKANLHLGEDDITKEDKEKYKQSLKFRITTYFNNTNGLAKHPTNGEFLP
jgi:DNA-directed RNA polymerase II subunit RPB1